MVTRPGIPGVVSFIVPAYNAAPTIGATIASIRASAPPGAEVVVVDDGSSDDTRAIAAREADHVVRLAAQGGAARSRNEGVREARGDVFVFVDADVTVTPGAVAGLLQRLEEGADAAFGAYEPLPPPELRDTVTTFKNLIHHHTHLRAAGDARTFWAGFGAVRRGPFLAVGGFDPEATRSADVEDIELGYRLSAAGYAITLDPTLQVRHHKRYTLGALIRSDLGHRAIPWTQTMLENRIVETGLNLRPAAVLSCVAVYGAVVSLAVGSVLPRAAAVTAPFLALWAFLNRDFLGYAKRVWPEGNALKLTGLLFLYYLYSPVGMSIGVLRHLVRRRHPSRSP